MSSRENQMKTPDSKQEQQGNRFNKQNSQKPAFSQQQEDSPDENFDLIKYLHKKQKTLIDNYGFGKSSKYRYPRYYFINQNRSILIILQGDITRTKVDAIVNAANEHMTGGGGVDGIIHRAAGNELYTACKAHKQLTHGVRLPTGHSRILLSYNMSTTTYYIINTAGPIYERYAAEECAKELSSCYKTALALANLYDLESIGFTAISCGIFGYPANQGADIALRTVDKEAGIVPVVVFVLWDNDIYDTWVQKAQELKFAPFDIENIPIENSLTPSNDNDQTETKKNLSANDNQPQTPTTFNPKVIDHSTKDETEKTSEKDIKSLLDKLPSVPTDMSDTQNTEDMEQDDNSINENRRLHTHQTRDMASMNLKEEKSTRHDDFEQTSVEETSNKQYDQQTKKNDGDDQSVVHKDKKKLHAEISPNTTNQGDQHNSSMTDNSGN
ncbi:unnamed protein product [Rotaria sp. Silwood2]|nr:unnamed protein product [Rotaria sp. Silwood2]